MRFNDITKAIKKRLAVGTGLPIYSENAKQFAKQPCIFVRLVEPKIVHCMNDEKYHVETLYQITFITSENEEKENKVIAEMAHTLFFLMQYIEIEGKLFRGTDITPEKTDEGILVMSVSYDFYAQLADKEKDTALMENLKIEVNANGKA